ncbi:PRC-barrel domain-containing protein [Microvirga massiliensis]|uniref:PRC-barrel domain-containing protein n=1 Tax=Microvirga massiliensis TaxID=1033741 RepID=UPI00066012BB|nr:PRC-barrel domain-containing protein [Microvirga massiliensis]
MRSVLLSALLGATALASAVQAQSPGSAPVAAPSGEVRAKAAISECDSLIAYLKQSPDPEKRVTLEQARAWRQELAPDPCRENLDRLTRAEESATKTDMAGLNSRTPNGPAGAPKPAPPQTAAMQTVPRDSAQQPVAEAAPPQVFVQQKQPNVTIRQKRPEIIVRQAPPIITVQQPQPEIIVRMPEPDVNIAMVQPQIEVRMAQPQVQIVPPQTQAQPNFEVDRQKPDVRFERTGEPEIIYQPAEGEPKIRFESADAVTAENTGSPSGNSAAQQDAPLQAPRTNLTQQGAQASLNSDFRSAVLATPANGPPQTGAIPGSVQQSLKISDLEARKVYGAGGAELGPITKVVSGPQDRRFLIVGYGGFLGLGRKSIAIPLDQIALRQDRLVASEVTDDSVKAMPEFKDGRGYRELDVDEAAVVPVLR